MWTLIIATVCAGLFAGAAIYINAVEHPARLSCGTEIAIREFAPSYHRATVMQAPLALTGCVTGLWSAWQHGDTWTAAAALLLGAVVPFTLSSSCRPTRICSMPPSTRGARRRANFL